jgi:guanylate kinase
MTGHIFIITGPSGVGKGTLCALLLKADPQCILSVSATSRPMRPGEKEGVNYYFKTREAFRAMVNHDQQEPDPTRHLLLEWAEYNQNFYGTPREPVEESLRQGFNVLLEIETHGAMQIKRKFPAACQIFIAPPNLVVLEQRLRSRGTEDETNIQNRLRIAQAELAQQNHFDYVVVNSHLEDGLREIREIIQTIQG